MNALDISSPLAKHPLGTTGLMVPSLCCGCALVGDMHDTYKYSVAEERALTAIRAMFDGPIPFADTAASYGESERRIGLVIRERGGLPDGFVLATKADRDFETGDFSGDQMRRSVERSLEWLGLERLQLVYIHDPEHTTFEAAMAPGGPVETLQQMKLEGLIEHLGVAGGPIDMMVRYVETGAFEVAITHNRYTLLNTSAVPLLDAGVQHGVPVLNASPYGSGILAKGPSSYPRYAYQEVAGDLMERAYQLENLCKEYQVPLAAVALLFSLRDPRVVSTIVGISQAERIAQTIELAQHPIPDALWEAMAAIPKDTIDPEANRFTSAK